MIMPMCECIAFGKRQKIDRYDIINYVMRIFTFRNIK